MREHEAPTWKLVAAFAAVYLIWGSTYLAIRIAIESIPPLLMLGGRFLIAGGVLFTVLRIAGVKGPSARNWKNAGLIGTLTLGAGTGAVATSELYVSSGVVALLVTTVPLFMIVLEWKWKKGVTPNRAIVGGLVLGSIGIALLVNPANVHAEGSLAGILSMIVLLLGSFSWSYGSLLSRDVDLPENPFMSTAMQMLGGGASLLIVGLVLGQGADFHFMAITRASWLALAYLFVFGSIIGFSSYVWLIKNATAGQVSTYAYVNPVVAVFLGWLIGGEILNARIILAMIILVAAVVLITRYGRRVPRDRRSIPEWMKKRTWIYALGRPSIGAQAATVQAEESVSEPEPSES